MDDLPVIHLSVLYSLSGLDIDIIITSCSSGPIYLTSPSIRNPLNYTHRVLAKEHGDLNSRETDNFSSLGMLLYSEKKKFPCQTGSEPVGWKKSHGARRTWCFMIALYNSLAGRVTIFLRAIGPSSSDLFPTFTSLSYPSLSYLLSPSFPPQLLQASRLSLLRLLSFLVFSPSFNVNYIITCAANPFHHRIIRSFDPWSQ